MELEVLNKLVGGDITQMSTQDIRKKIDVLKDIVVVLEDYVIKMEAYNEITEALANGDIKVENLEDVDNLLDKLSESLNYEYTDEERKQLKALGMILIGLKDLA